MERSRKRTPIQRSKGACSVGLIVSLGCAFFGVGGAVAGDGKYARHVRQVRLEARLAGAALAHRTPEQLVLAITPKRHHAPARVHHSPAPAPASTPAPAAPTAASTTLTDTSAQPAASPPATPAPTSTTLTDTSTPAAAAATTGVTSNLGAGTAGTGTTGTTGTSSTDTTATPSNTATTGTTGTSSTDTTATPSNTATTGTDTSGTTTTTTTTGTDTTTTGTDTTAATTTTNGTDTTLTTGTDTTITTGAPGSTDGTGPGNSDGHGRPWWAGRSNTGGSGQPAAAGFTGAGVNVCHGRCDTSSQSGSVVPASLPSSTSPSTSGSFTLGVTPAAATAPTPAATAVTSTPVNAVSSPSPLLPTTPVATVPSTPVVGPLTTLGAFPTFSSTSALRHLSHGSTRGSSRTTTPGAAGSGAVTAAAVSTPRTAVRATTVATGTPVARGAAKPAPATHKAAKRSTGSASSPLPGAFNPAVTVVRDIVKVIPTAVWIALGAAFGLALAFAAIALRAGRRARRREREFKAISAAAATDALTGILNRRGFMDAAERELARASRYERPFVLAYVDVRGLKAVNDTEGHLVGDELIQAVAGLMKESARADDVVGRIGGDEFALLLDEQTAEGAQPVLRRIRSRVAERRAAMEIRVPWELTIGIAAFPEDGTTLEELLGTADRRLYEQRGIALR